MKKFRNFLTKGIIILSIVCLFVFTLTPQKTRNRIAGYIAEVFFSDTIAGMAHDVDGNPVFYSDGSEGAKVFLQMARMPDYLNEIMEKAEGGNLSKGQVLRLTCSKDKKTVIRARIVNDRSAFYANPEAPLSQGEKAIEMAMKDNRPFDKTFPEGASVEEVIKSLPFFEKEETLVAVARAN